LYFSLNTGKVITKSPCTAKAFNPDWKLATFPVTVVDDEVWVNTVSNNGVPSSLLTEDNLRARITLSKKEIYNHDSFIFTFTVDSLTKVDMLTFSDKKQFKKMAKSRIKLFKMLESPFECWHFDLQDINATVVREYTPISTWKELKEQSKIELLIKLYPDGVMSNILAKSEVGAKFYMRRPKQTIKSKFFHPYEDIRYAFIAGGTGITPCYQMLEYIHQKLSYGQRAPRLTLLFSNKREEDILLKNQLIDFSKKLETHFKVYFTLTREDPQKFESSQSPYIFGRVNGEQIETLLSPTTHQHVFVSGPESMWDTIFPILIEKGYTKSSCTELEA